MLILTLGLIIIINLILESTILPLFPVFGYVPNISLVATIILSFRKGKYYGAFFGLSTGLIYDILFGKVIGVKALIYFLIGYYSGELNESFNNDNILIPVLFSAIGTIIYNSLYSLLIFFTSNMIDFSEVVDNVFSLEILYNLILTFIILKIYNKIFTSPSLRFGKK